MFKLSAQVCSRYGVSKEAQGFLSNLPWRSLGGAALGGARRGGLIGAGIGAGLGALNSPPSYDPYTGQPQGGRLRGALHGATIGGAWGAGLGGLRGVGRHVEALGGLRSMLGGGGGSAPAARAAGGGMEALRSLKQRLGSPNRYRLGEPGPRAADPGDRVLGDLMRHYGAPSARSAASWRPASDLHAQAAQHRLRLERLRGEVQEARQGARLGRVNEGLGRLGLPGV